MESARLTKQQFVELFLDLTTHTLGWFHATDVEVKEVVYVKEVSEVQSMGHLYQRCVLDLIDVNSRLSYQLTISYADPILENNPEIILVERLAWSELSTDVICAIGNVGLVTDKLRQYGVW